MMGNDKKFIIEYSFITNNALCALISFYVNLKNNVNYNLYSKIPESGN